MRATRDIHVGEELLLSYLGEEEGAGWVVAQRRAWTEAKYNFRCVPYACGLSAAAAGVSRCLALFLAYTVHALF